MGFSSYISSGGCVLQNWANFCGLIALPVGSRQTAWRGLGLNANLSSSANFQTEPDELSFWLPLEYAF
ncbi:hypothetical protein YQ44_21375 [Janthinobacterium sp. 1_2014MBL_MicDiv]|nr:hypothetical protein YQ44_21375 [Janthinobacterium sp. 1_2014MBL_MicDiv]